MPEKRNGEFLRGLAWNIPASIGAPADLAETVLNLGLAGGGYLGHKLGLLGADQLPQLLEGSPGTTKWWAKGTPMEESADPNFVKGQFAGGLAAALYPSIKSKVDHGKLRSLITPDDWPQRFGLAKTTQDGRPLGALPGDLPGTQHVALPRKLSADETFSARNRAQIDQPGGVPLAQLAPEIANSPAEGLRVVSGRHAATPLGVNSGGHADMANNQLVLGMGPDAGSSYGSNWLMNALHHEGTHGIDALAGSPGHGFAPLLPDEFTRAYRWLMSNGDEGRALAKWLHAHQPDKFYRGNLGEARAFVAGDTAGHLAPSAATLEIYNKKNRAGNPMNWFTNVQDAQGWFRLPLPESMLKDSRLVITPGSDGWDLVSLGSPGLADSPGFGLLDQRFRLSSNQPGGRPDWSKIAVPPRQP